MRNLKKSIGSLDAEAAAKLVAVTTDIAVLVDNDGIVRDYSIGSENLSRHSDFASWIGKPWIDTVTVESRPKIQQLLVDAGKKQPAPWRQVNHPTGGTNDLPVRYSAMRLGQNGGIVALGRELWAMSVLQQKLIETQQAMEREYARVRYAETRYRLLFQLSGEPVIIIDATTLRIVDANPAAVRMLGTSAKKVLGRSLEDFFNNAGSAALQGMLAAVRSNGSADAIRATLAGAKATYVVSASLFRQETTSQLLVRLIPESGAAKQTDRPQASAYLAKLVNDMPDAFVVTGLDLRILTVNKAFVELAQLTTLERAQGEHLERWLGRTSIDLGVLARSVLEQKSVRNFSTIVRGEQGIVEEVEISAIASQEADPPCLGFVIRPAARSTAEASDSQDRLPRTARQLTGLVGQVPLKTLVRETTDLIERLCIEAALQLVGDNRASAAEMLGLSRQSLYLKLRRYGLGDLQSEQ